MRSLLYEEIEAAEEFGPFYDFAMAAAPFVAIGIAIAIIVVRLTVNRKSSNS
ncbi:MAG: hypothetical protein N2489_04590 [Clostridia bacterium]|nr:hypothetical protein [Clostridia bacterium]